MSAVNTWLQLRDHNALTSQPAWCNAIATNSAESILYEWQLIFLDYSSNAFL